jgi:hypothetical protein
VKKLLVYLSPERHCSLFDNIVAYDAGADAVIPYAGVNPEDVEEIIHGCCFTRHPRDLVNTGVFVGGRSIIKAEELAIEAARVLNRLPQELRVNLAVDPNGAYTTATACVAKIASSTAIKGAKAVILAGTGPVGISTARLLAGEGTRVTITSRSLEKAKQAAETLKPFKITPLKADSEKTSGKAVEDADIVVATGPPAATLLPKEAWLKDKKIKTLADTNIVPPYGIEGIKPRDDGTTAEGRICYGAMAIGGLKMKLHQEIIHEMFEERGKVFNLEGIYKFHQNTMLG